MSQSLSRALRLLNELGEGPRSLDDLAALLDVHKTTVLRLLRTLEGDRLVFRDAAYRYHLGAGLFALSSRALEQRPVRATAAPHLAALNRETGHTVHLAAYEGGEVVYIDKYDSRHPVRMYSRIGLRARLHCTAVAKVLLAGLPEAERRAVAGSIEYEAMTPNTLTGPEALLAELSRVAEQGYAVDHGEHETFINCVGAPIRDAGGRVVAAASISVPAVLLDFEQVLAVLPDLLKTTAAVSADCGWHEHPIKKAEHH
ncbi:IclR family transcriptional regulator [Actinospica sp. MGRD01-02]|uniref:IclR family transcriptional regulator n=1 Tax=Actinospica acidithermotolerans TaxID=2828514 RepID=A0A941IFX8_9ACTN|nr:IclR family transcriptional regulator [Actinospica acidithermotolerans]MBR7825524.1 IclR family transcriptional regulator [Actinospica acidithermotolerans]